MNCNLGIRTNNTARLRNLAMAVLMCGCAFGLVGQAGAQRVTPPTTPDLITPPEGATAFLLGHGVGTQGYVCLPTTTGSTTASWTVNNARPEATLFLNIFGQEVEIVTHFLSPNTNPSIIAPKPLPFANATWQSSVDSSKVWAQTVHAIPPGNDPSCPDSNAISCLLLQAIGSDKGPTGGKFLTQTSFIQRLNTKGGSAPETGCSVQSDVGKQTLVPYSADYYFYHGGE